MYVVQDLIERKRDGEELNESELSFLVTGYTEGSIPDYQISAFFMAVFFRGLSPTETTHFMKAKIATGKSFDWSRYGTSRVFVDKHSTGGVGDKTSLVILPLLIADGFDVPMVGGRGLGHTGGTVDKLESIPGFKVQIDHRFFSQMIEKHHGAFGAQTNDFVPADKKMYALRDVTATVASIGLITASIMSKKLSEGLSALVLDVKFGSGAFMKTYAHAVQLAKSMQSVGNLAGCRTIAALTNMNEPLGRAVGNACEVAECLDVLSGAGPRDTRELSLRLAAGAVAAAKNDTTIAGIEKAYARLRNHLDSGRAFEIFCEIAVGQGACLADVERRNTEWMTGDTETIAVRAKIDGNRKVVSQIDTQEVGMAIVELGGGRRQKEDHINPFVGLTELKKIGDEVAADVPLCLLRYQKGSDPSRAVERLQKAYMLAESVDKETQEPLIKEWIL